jgi:hypothetical protein
MQLEIKVEEISASNNHVQIKGFSQQRGYSIVAFPSDIDIPKLGSVMVLDVTFKPAEVKFEPEVAMDKIFGVKK